MIPPKPTYRAQMNNKTSESKFTECAVYLNQLNTASANYPLSHVFSIDEIEFEIDLIGEKGIESNELKSNQNKFTVIATISAEGKILPFYVIFKGLENVPFILKTTKFPANFALAVSETGLIDCGLMRDYYQRVLSPEIKNKRCLMVIDEYNANLSKMRIQLTKMNIESLLIPDGYSSYLNPLSNCVNKTLKSVYKRKWNEWLVNGINGQIMMTDNGNRMRPSYDLVLEWLNEAAGKIDLKTAQSSFVRCGLFHHDKCGHFSEFVQLVNKRLKSMLLINENLINPNRDLSLFSILMNEFDDTSSILVKIEQHLTTFKPQSKEIDDNVTNESENDELIDVKPHFKIESF